MTCRSPSDAFYVWQQTARKMHDMQTSVLHPALQRQLLQAMGKPSYT